MAVFSNHISACSSNAWGENISLDNLKMSSFTDKNSNQVFTVGAGIDLLMTITAWTMGTSHCTTVCVKSWTSRGEFHKMYILTALVQIRIPQSGHFHLPDAPFERGGVGGGERRSTSAPWRRPGQPAADLSWWWTNSQSYTSYQVHDTHFKQTALHRDLCWIG